MLHTATCSTPCCTLHNASRCTLLHTAHCCELYTAASSTLLLSARRTVAVLVHASARCCRLHCCTLLHAAAGCTAAHCCRLLQAALLHTAAGCCRLYCCTLLQAAAGCTAAHCYRRMAASAAGGYWYITEWLHVMINTDLMSGHCVRATMWVKMSKSCIWMCYYQSWTNWKAFKTTI